LNGIKIPIDITTPSPKGEGWGEVKKIPKDV
jgi:hypothetical protein